MNSEMVRHDIDECDSLSWTENEKKGELPIPGRIFAI